MTFEISKLVLDDFKSFRGHHEYSFRVPAGLYYIAGVNKVEPALGANGSGKSTFFLDAIFWILFNKTVRASRPGEAVVPWGTKGNPVRGELCIKRDGKAHKIIRTRNPNSLKIVRKGVEEEVGQDRVDALVGLSEQAVRHTIIIGQFGALFLSLKPEQQSAMFTDMLDLDVWVRGSQLATAAVRKYEKLLADANNDYSAIRGRYDEIQTQLDETIEKRANFAAENKQDIDDTRRKLNRAQADLTEFDAQSVEDSGDLPAGKAEAYEARLAIVRVSLRAAEQKLGNIKSQYQIVGDSIKDLKRKLDEYKAASQTRTCPDCGQSVTNRHLADKVAGIESQLSELDVKDKALAQKLELSTIEVSGFLTKEETLTEKITAAKKLARERSEDKQNRDGDRRELADLVSAYQAGLNLLKNAINPHITSVGKLLERRDGLKADRREASAKVKRLAVKVDSNKYWVTAFREIRLRQIDETIEELELAANRHAEALGLIDWRIKFVTERENTSGALSQGFTAYLYPPNSKTPITWESYSGGESQRWQLAVTFGLAEVLLDSAGISPNIEILDEPTQHLSAEGVDDLLEHLRSRAKELNRVIYFVDHRSYDSGLFDGRITVVKDKNGSRVVLH